MQLLLIGDYVMLFSGKGLRFKKIDISMLSTKITHKISLKILFQTSLLNDTILEFIQNYKGKHLEIEFPIKIMEQILCVCKKNIYTNKLILTSKYILETYTRNELDMMFYELLFLRPCLYLVKFKFYEYNSDVLPRQIKKMLTIRSYNKKIRNTKLFELLLS